MRTLGRPPASLVASATASGRPGSLAAASSNQAANSRSGSSASVKSPDVNQIGCLIGADSDILRSTQVVASMPGFRQRLYSASPRLWHMLQHLPAGALVLALGCATGACSFSYQLDSLFGKSDDKADE